MDAKLKADWVSALRSGEYQQAIGSLRDEDGAGSYCCLGVLCKVVGAEFGETEGEDGVRKYRNVPLLNGRLISDRDNGELDESFCVEVGITDQAQLIILNDGHDGTQGFERSHSFSEIADYIEKNL